jgi:hypothetical protein
MLIGRDADVLHKFHIEGDKTNREGEAQAVEKVGLAQRDCVREQASRSSPGGAKESSMSDGRILIAYDGSENARHAIEVAAAELGVGPATVLQRLQADSLDARVDPDRASRADTRAAARALPRPRLRLRRGTRARRRVRLHRPHPRPRRGSTGAQTRSRLPGTPLGRRTHPLLAQPLPPHSHPAGRNAQTPTSQCSTSPADSSPGAPPTGAAYRNRL